MEKVMYIKKGRSIYRIGFDEIVMIEQQGRYTIITTDKRELRFTGTIKDMEDMLDDGFYRCHRSYIVNLEKITELEDQQVRLEGGFVVYLGRENFRRTKARMCRFMASKKV